MSTLNAARREQLPRPREPFHSIAVVRLWWRNATTRFAIHHRAVMSHAVYPVKWIQSTLGGDVTDERRGGTETRRYGERERGGERYVEWESRAGEHRLHKRVAQSGRGGVTVGRVEKTGVETEGGEGWHSYYVTTHREIARCGDAAKGDRAMFRPSADKSLCAARLIFKLPLGNCRQSRKWSLSWPPEAEEPVERARSTREIRPDNFAHVQMMPRE